MMVNNADEITEKEQTLTLDLSLAFLPSFHGRFSTLCLYLGSKCNASFKKSLVSLCVM
jgi:hypothetical protein